MSIALYVLSACCGLILGAIGGAILCGLLALLGAGWFWFVDNVLCPEHAPPPTTGPRS